MIDSQTRQRILDAANILDVVSDFISLRRSGVSYVGLCPFHSDRKPSFYVSPSKNVCKCFACGEGGSPVHFLMKHEQLSYQDALRYLAKKYHIEIVEREETDEEKREASERQSLFVINDYAAKYFAQQLLETDEGQRVGLSYFRERGIRPETIQKFGLGYSPEQRDALTQAALAAGHSLERLTAVGLSIQYDDKPPVDRFRGRVIFPVRNLSGQYVAFGGRIMGKSDKIAKYVNSPESAIYSKSHELYGLYWAKQAISKADKCYLVEGYTDVISMHQSGIENVVASSGTALTIPQIRQIRRFTEHVTVLYDGDTAGIKAALRGIDLLLEEGLHIQVVLLPEGEDPDSYARSHTAEEFLSYLKREETDFIHFKINLYREEMQRDPLKRAELIKDILRSIALIPDTIRRTVLIQSSASELKISEETLMSEVAKLRAQGTTARPDYARQPTKPVSGVQQSSLASTTEAPNSQPEQLAEGSTTDTRGRYEPQHYELSLLKLIIQNGGQSILVRLGEADEGDAYSERILVDYLYEELDLDGILEALSPVCYDVLLEARQHCLHGDTSSEQYFTNHESEAIRKLSTDLLMSELKHAHATTEQEDYKLHSLEAKVVSAISPESKQEAQAELEAYQGLLRQKEQRNSGERAIWELDQMRMAIVLKSIDSLQQQMKEAERLGDTDRVLRLLRELQEENSFKQELAQTLGERTIKA